MSRTKPIRIWFIFTILWMFAVPFLVSSHYAALRKPSAFLYNPFADAEAIVEANDDSRALLIKMFPGTWNNNYSIGIPGKVEIAYPLQFDTYNNAYTWVPINNSLIKVPTGSKEWKAFKQELIADGVRLRNKAVKEILHQYLLQDILSMLGPPLFLLLLLIARRVVAKKLAGFGEAGYRL